ncbi:uncharacterized protein EDB93DRAFT_1291133 [Suillus bovinus]|uniref:uncharacterized protein n=1 Tax=Suillus bovinus TaxID=48563 RepID=UPI001B882694|nr:uncharacterized protein EDB93DRAFT_1291133 [Suillus bovinus]KAG2143809.1 hypothetical protein EDB93DRAFT_1291133 [Suillus bovinus]
MAYLWAFAGIGLIKSLTSSCRDLLRITYTNRGLRVTKYPVGAKPFSFRGRRILVLHILSGQRRPSTLKGVFYLLLSAMISEWQDITHTYSRPDIIVLNPDYRCTSYGRIHKEYRKTEAQISVIATFDDRPASLGFASQGFNINIQRSTLKSLTCDVTYTGRDSSLLLYWRIW